jgi:hypothetical protein
MIVIPFQIEPSGRTFSVLVILEQENIDRLKEYDPATIGVATQFPKPWCDMKLYEIVISFGTSEDIAKARNMTNFTDVLKHFTKGFKFSPELGDSDDNYKVSGGTAGGMN